MTMITAKTTLRGNYEDKTADDSSLRLPQQFNSITRY